jgi:hypothetical protein
MAQPALPPLSPPAPPQREAGVALVLALIFSILLYILVAELVVAGRMVRATGENDALLARMRTQMLYQLHEAEDQLLQDLAGAAANEGEGGGAEGLGNAMQNAARGAQPGTGSSTSPGPGGNAAGAEGGEGEEDPSANCDSSRDAWFEPVGHPDNDLTTYVWVEDENRKFNLLSIWSPDEKFATFSQDRLVRLLDALREDTEFDLPSSDAQRIVQDLLDWGKRSGTEQMPRPRQKSDDEQRRELCAISHLDDLLLLPSVTEELFFDKVLDGRWYPGLESVLTVWTSLRVDPGDPEKLARQRAAAEQRGEVPKPTDPPAASSGEQGAGQNAGQQGGNQAGGNRAAGQAGNEQPPPQPDGLGIKVNVNTAPRAVLRALFPPEKIPDRVIDAILEFRNKVDEEATEADRESTETTELADFGDMQLGAEQKKKFFAEVADLEQVEEFKKLPDPEIKAAFQAAVTTKSEVFSIHLASLFKRSDENRIYVLRRARAVVLRVDDGADGKIVPIVPFEERIGLRLQPVDLQDITPDLAPVYADMDRFAQEDRAWNPFYIDFYMPQHMRQEFYSPR